MRVKTDLYVTIPEDAEQEDMIFEWQLFSCASENAPTREEHPGKSFRDEHMGILTLCEDVKEEAWITLDLTSTHKRTRRDDGSHDNYEAVKIAIVFKMGDERGTLMVEALHGRKVLGTARIDYARAQARQIVSQSVDLLDG